MVFHKCDRIQDDLEPGAIALGNDVLQFNNVLSDLIEFDQPLFTCKYAGGSSKLDRCCSSLKPLDFNMLGTACNVLGVHAELSDHFHVSCKLFNRPNCTSVVKSWISSSDVYNVESASYLPLQTQLRSVESEAGRQKRPRNGANGAKKTPMGPTNAPLGLKMACPICVAAVSDLCVVFTRVFT